MNVISNVIISNIACCVPEQTVYNNNVPGFEKERIEKIISSTGVIKRRVAPKGCCASDLCYKAANYIFDQKSIDKSEIGILIFVSQTPDYRLPATACVLHNKFGLSEDTIAFDVNLGCSGYVYGLYLASLMLQNSTKKYALLLAGETTTSYCSELDSSTAFLFGDAGSASLLEKKFGSPLMYFKLASDGVGWKNLIIPAGGYRKPSNSETAIRKEDEAGNLRSEDELYMDGMEIFNFAISTVVPHIKNCIEKHSDYSAVIFHQANRFMLEFMRKALKIDKSKFHYSLLDFGNTSPVTIPLTLCHNREVADYTKVLMTGFGVGYSWGTAIVEMTDTIISDVIEWGEEYE